MGENTSELPQTVSTPPPATETVSATEFSMPVKRRPFLKRATLALAGLGLALFAPRVAEAKPSFQSGHETKKDQKPNSMSPAAQPSVPVIFPVFPSEAKKNQIQIPNKPDNESGDAGEVPEQFKARIEKVTKSASQFLHKHEEIKLDIKPGQWSSVYARYSPAPGPESIIDTIAPSLNIRYSKNDKPDDVANLEIGDKVAEIIRQSKGKYLSEKLTNAFSEVIGINLKGLKWETCTSKEKEILSAIVVHFDFNPFAEVNQEKSESSFKTIVEELNDRIMSFWLMNPEKMADNFKTTQPILQPLLANLAGRALQLNLAQVPVGTNWASLGIDENNIYKILERSKNSELKKNLDTAIEALK